MPPLPRQPDAFQGGSGSLDLEIFYGRVDDVQQFLQDPASITQVVENQPLESRDHLTFQDLRTMFKYTGRYPADFMAMQQGSQNAREGTVQAQRSKLEEERRETQKWWGLIGPCHELNSMFPSCQTCSKQSCTFIACSDVFVVLVSPYRSEICEPIHRVKKVGFPQSWIRWLNEDHLRSFAFGAQLSMAGRIRSVDLPP